MLRYISIVNRGLVHETNDDTALIGHNIISNGKIEGVCEENNEIFAIADGVGGLKCSELASREVLRTISECKPQDQDDLLCKIQNANWNILKIRDKKKLFPNISSTLCIATILDEKIVTYNLGNSRAYRFRDGILLQMTKDQTKVQKLYDAGADRYLLRHEAADPELYQKLHPESLSLENRIQCLWNLKEIGYAVGTGFMVGAPYQTVENLADDLLFIKELDPQMVGIGPFVPHHDTRFKEFPSGSVELTTYLVSILRLMNPHLLLPSTTALGTIDPRGREKGILAGANVVMRNLSPVAVRKDYSLYDNKICTGEEAAECAGCLGRRLASIDYQLVFSRGDYIE